jgi:alkane 1-monooxygenase
MKLERALFYSVRYTSQFSPLVALAGIWAGGGWAWAGFSLVFGYYLFVELLLTLTGLGVDSNAENEYEHEDPKNPRWLDHYGVAISGALLLMAVPASFYLLATNDFSLSQKIGAVLSLAIVSGTVGGLVGHEYIHRTSKWERALGVMVYAIFNYAHFSVSHVYGHHRLIGLREDWSTSRRGETSYAFFIRAYVTGYIGAWKLTAQNLARKKQAFWSLQNFMLRWTLVQAAAALALVSLLGFPAALSLLGTFLAYSAVSICLSEMVNYLSHYGLTRDAKEQVALHHSWESANKVTNWFIFNAGKHSEHHTKPTRPHFQLRLGPETEKLPYGLLLLTVIALIPPLYFKIMNPLVDRWEADRDHERHSDYMGRTVTSNVLMFRAAKPPRIL